MNQNSLLVRINYTTDNIEAKNDTVRYKAHIGKNDSSNGKYIICGGIYNKKGGMIIYQAKNAKEAKEMEINNIMINNNNRKYKQVKKDVISIPRKLIH